MSHLDLGLHCLAATKYTQPDPGAVRLSSTCHMQTQVQAKYLCQKIQGETPVQAPAGGHTDSGPLDPFILPTNTFRDLLHFRNHKEGSWPWESLCLLPQGMWRLCLMLSHE